MTSVDGTGPAPPRLSPNALLGRICLSAALSIADLVYTVVYRVHGQPQPAWTVITIGLFGAVGWLLVFFRRRRPAAIAIIICCCAAVSPLASGPFAWSLCSLATTLRWRRYTWVGVAVMIVYAIQTLLPIDLRTGLPNTSAPTLSVKGVAFFVLTVAAATVITMVATGICGGALGEQRRLLWQLRDRTLRAEAERDLRTEQARSMERERIAREMHDGLAHRISQISVHAGALAYRPDLDVDQVSAAATTIQQSSHQALIELRDVLGVLRDPAAADGAHPVAAAADLDELIESHRAMGMVITVQAHPGALDDLAAPVDRAVYRIIQEALTNAGRHAFGQPVSLRVSEADGTLQITVRNPIAPGPRPGTPLPESGYGLVGLTERVALLGGSLDTTRSGSDFTLQVRLPLGS